MDFESSGSASVLSFVSELVSEPTTEPISEPTTEPTDEPAPKSASPQESPGILAENPGNEFELCKEDEKGPEKEVGSSHEPGIEAGPGKEVNGKTDELSEEKPVNVSGAAGKKAKSGQKKGKGKTVVPQQHNLGDYL
jgi:hypothetical protein